ncbi:MAG: GtrA family protein [Acidobacteriaceae bacterium]|jgi:putative flippase GtrA
MAGRNQESSSESKATPAGPAVCQDPNDRSRWIRWITNHFPPGQFGRYLVIGLLNTAFGYSTYAGLTALLTPHIPFAYLLASVIANFLAVTFSFLNYKWFIFKTKGNYLREWSRCVAVYGGAMATGTLLLPIVVFLMRHLTPADRSAPYIAFALLMGITTVAGFLGHKNFSFAPSSGSGERRY